MLVERDQSCLMIVDVQERLLPAMVAPTPIVDNAGVLIRAAARLTVPILVSEQYPRGLGHTVAALARHLPNSATVVEKVAFSCLSDPAFADCFRALGRRQAIVAGIEAHVCVMQTAAQLLAAGTRVFVVADACGSRVLSSYDAAMARLRNAGAEIVTTEMVVFEWLRVAATPEFKELSALIK